MFFKTNINLKILINKEVGKKKLNYRAAHSHGKDSYYDLVFFIIFSLLFTE